MRKVSWIVSSLLLLIAFAPCALADEAMPAAPATPGDEPAPAAAPPAAQPPAPPAPTPPPAAVVAGSCGCCPAPSTCCPPRNPCRRVRLEVQAGVSLLRPDPEGRVTVPNPAAPNEAFWDALDYDLAISGRVAATIPWQAWDLNVAGTFWGLWDEDETLTNVFLSSSAFPGGPPAGNTFPVVELESEAILSDLNVTVTRPFRCSPCFTAAWGAGLRFLHFDEESSYRFEGNPPIRTLRADLHNYLLAGEAVVEGTWKLGSRWELFARVSAFAGWMHKTGEVTFDNPNVPTAESKNTADDFGFGGEAEVALRWHVSSCWTLSLGYDLLVMGEVARGYKAIDVSRATPPVDFGPTLSDDWITVHRVYLGVTFDL